MGSVFGRYFTVSTFGESHGAAVGAVVDGVPAGLDLDPARIQQELDRRRPGTSPYVSPRNETDQAEILSGTAGGKTLGTPIAILIRNRDVRSKDYDAIREMFRPGHADYTYFKKYGVPPQPGGGRSSGRETAGRVAAGAVAKIFLESRGVTVRGCTVGVGPVRAARVDYVFAESHPLRCADPDAAQAMTDLVDQAREQGDSIGGLVETTAFGAPAGLGDPVFHKLEASLGGAALSIGGVKGVEFGTGFELARRRGSEANDQISEEGFLSNHCGGILGGISTGQPIIMRLAVKPTSSISKPQSTIDLAGKNRTIQTRGRHDPCLCARIVPVAEAMTALVLADALLEQTARRGEWKCG
ncbi:MAG: chorismate synthase [Pseudomonadota bacterium]